MIARRWARRSARSWPSWAAFGAATLGATSAGATDPSAALVVTEAASDRLEITQTGKDLSLDLHVEETANVKAGKVTVEAWLLGPRGNTKLTACTIDGEPCTGGVDIAALGSKVVHVEATLPDSGVYRGAIALVHATGRARTRIEVTRKTAALPVEITAPDALLGTDGKVTIPVFFRETAGRPIELAATTTGLRCKRGETEKAPVDGLAGKAAKSELTAFGEGHVALEQTVPAAGECELDVEVSAPDHQTARKSVKLFLRRSSALGVGLVSLSVVASFFLRWLTVVRAPTLALRTRLLKARDDLDLAVKALAPMTSAEQLVAETLHGAIRLAYAASKPVETDVAALEEKVSLLPLWVRESRRRKPLTLRDAAKTKIDGALRDAASALTTPHTAAQIQAAAATLRAAALDIDAALETQIREPIAALRADIDARPPHLADKLATARAALDRADLALDRGDFATAREEHDRARGTCARAFADHLREGMPDAPPAGFTAPGSWARFREETSRKLDDVSRASDAAALAQYARVHGAYLARLIEALSDECEIRTETEADATIKASLKIVTKALTEAGEAQKSGDLTRATERYERAATTYDKLRPKLQSSHQADGTDLEAAPASPAAPPALDPGALADVRADATPVVLPSLAALQRSSLHTEIALTIAVLAIAVLIGFQTLHIGGPTWGTDEDCLVAILWGFGLHQASGAAFVGIPGLRKLLASKE